MRMANEARGEVAVDLAGARLVLRPSFEALARIEGATGAGLFALARRMETALTGAGGDLRAADVAAVLEAGQSEHDRDRVEALIAEAGLIAAAGAAFAFLVRALTGGPEKNANAPAADPPARTTPTRSTGAP